MIEEQPALRSIYVPDLTDTTTLLQNLLACSKGVEHPIFLEQSTLMDRDARRRVRERLYRRVKRAGGEIPYSLRWYTGPGLICYWLFVDANLDKEKEWFDANAGRGVYPDVRKYERKARNVETTDSLG